MKALIALMLCLSPAAFAAPYIEYKNSWNIPERKDVHNLRLGYKTEKNFYGEIGPRSNGYAAETGYKIKKGAFTFKGKWEGSKTDEFKHKLETEIRYDL